MADNKLTRKKAKPSVSRSIAGGDLKPAQSAAFIKGLFENRQSVAQDYGPVFDMPHWYQKLRMTASAAERYSVFLFRNDEEDEAAAKMKSLAIARMTQTDQVPEETLQEKVDKILRGCAQEAVNQVLLDADTLSSLPEIPKDPVLDSERWLCKDTVEKPVIPPTDDNKMDMASYRKRILKKLDEAIALLIEKFESEGEYPRSEWQECDPRLQYGIDVTPTESQCAASRQRDESDYIEETPGTEERTKAYVETPTPTPPKGKRRPWREGLFCPIMDLSIESLVLEPTAESLLMRVGALNEDGELSCNLKTFNDVQHFIRKLLVLWAIEVEARDDYDDDEDEDCGDNDDEEAEGDDDEEEAVEKPKVSFKQEEHETTNIYTHMKKALAGEINKENFRKERSRQLSGIFLGSNQLLNQPRTHKSMTPEKMEEVKHRLAEAINRVESYNDSEADIKQLKQSIFEILPFDPSRSFDADDFNMIEDVVEDAPVRLKSLIAKQLLSERIHWPVRSELKHEDLLNIRDCIPESEIFQAQKLNFFQWQNRRLVDDMKDLTCLTEAEKDMMLTIKYFSHWLDVMRKGRILKGVCCTSGRTKMIEGGYPKHGLELIRCFEQDPDYFPDSRKEYAKKLKAARAALQETIAELLEEFSFESELCEE